MRYFKVSLGVMPLSLVLIGPTLDGAPNCVPVLALSTSVR
jgi:hypothetical protein